VLIKGVRDTAPQTATQRAPAFSESLVTPFIKLSTHFRSTLWREPPPVCLVGGPLPLFMSCLPRAASFLSALPFDREACCH